jgi:hypothetical protein
MDTNLKHSILPESSQFEVIEACLGTGVERKDDFLMLTGKRSEFVWRDNWKRRYAMGDKGKKDKDKGRKQKINKQEQRQKRR